MTRPASATQLTASFAAEIALDLHGLCQPLTALQCRLEIGRMDATLVGFDDAVVDALRECLRVNALVRAMQEKVIEFQRDEHMKQHPMSGER